MSLWSSGGAVPRRVLVALFIIVLVASSVLTARPAAAVTVTVTTRAEVEAAFDNATGPDYRIVLGADITMMSGPFLDVPAGQKVHLELNGYTLHSNVTNVDQEAGIGVPATAHLEVSDSVGGGLLRVWGGDFHPGLGGGIGEQAGTITIVSGVVEAFGGVNGAGIGGAQAGSGGSVTIQPGAMVTANGGEGGAGIGGGANGDGGQVTINGGTVTATGGFEGAGIGSGLRAADADAGTVTINGGTVTATGGPHGAGIGGGSEGYGADVEIGSAATVTAKVQAGDGSAIGAGTMGLDFGSLHNAGTLILPQYSLFVAHGGSMTNSGTIRNAASIEGDGTIFNTGVIVNTGTVGGDITVTNNSYLLQFHAEGGSPEPDDQWVYAPTLAMAEEALPAAPVRQGHQFLGWFRQPGAPGAPVSSSTSLGDGNGPTTVPLYAGWEGAATPTTLSLSPANAQIEAGDGVTYVVSGEDQFGNPIDVSEAVLTSSVSDDVITGRAVTAEQAGTRTITATLGDVTATASLTVNAAPASTLSITPASSQIVAGESVTYTVTGADEYGNSIDASGAVVTSSGADDEISNRTITTYDAGERTITATMGNITATASLTVTAAPLATLAITPADTQVTAGTSVDYNVTGADRYGNPVAVADAVISSSEDSDEVSGWTLTPTVAGDRTITAALGEVQATADLAVTAAPLSTLAITPADTQTTAGTSVDYNVTGSDRYGNPVDAFDAVITSSQEDDQVTDWTVTAQLAGERTITATLGDVAATATLTVDAAAAATLSLAADSEVVAGTAVDVVATAADEFGNPVDTTAVVITSSEDSDDVAGLTVTPTVVGERTLTARLGELTATAPMSVTPAAPANLKLWIEDGQSPVAVGGSLTLGVSATDEFGNPVDTTGVVITSSVATDVIAGLTVRFPTASPHTLTATLGDATASLTVEVTPDQEPTPAEPGDDAPPVDQPPSSNDAPPTGLPNTGAPGSQVVNATR